MVRALDGVRERNGGARLPGEQVHRMRRMMPKQVIGPGAWLAERVQIAAPKKKCLHVHLQYAKLAVDDASVQPLVRRIEPAGVAHHAGKAGALLDLSHRFGIGPVVGQRDLDLHVLAGLHALDRLGCVHRAGRAQDRGAHPWLRQGLPELGRDLADDVLLRDRPGLVDLPPHQRYHLDTADQPQRIQVFLAEGTDAGQYDFHRALYGWASGVRPPPSIMAAYCSWLMPVISAAAY